MTYFCSLHLHLQVLSKEDLKGTRIEHGFKRAFMSLFGQDDDTFTSTMFLNVDQLQKQLDKDEFQEDGSMAVFWVVNRQFQKFIDSQFSLDYDSNVKKFVAKRTRHLRQYDRRVNKRQMKTQESKINMGKVLDAYLVVTESSGTESKVQDKSSRSENDTDDADIRPIYDEEPMDEGQILNDASNKSKMKKEIDAFETINIELEHDVAKLLAENEHLHNANVHLKQTYKDLYDSIKKTRVQTKDHNDSLIVQLYNKSTKNVDLKVQIQEKVFAIAALKNELRKLKGNSVDTKFAKPSALGKLVLQSLRNQSVVRQPNAFKSKRPKISKPRFAFQVDVKNDLSKPVTQHYLPKGKESTFAKPHHVIASSESINSSKNMPRFSSNDMVHNHYLDEARKRHKKETKTNAMPSARFQSIADKCVFNANHDACITKFLKEVNSRAKIQSHKTINNNKSVEQKSHIQKRGRQIVIGHMFSPNKSYLVYEKTSLRSDLRWKPTGRIFKFVSLRWIPTGKSFDSCTGKVNSEPHMVPM
ncbi:hypothetical protein Tco_0799452 [Tanacetum coccineum]|uniref:Uncharacterized protein n=1 Tax=Tanacetum coccineum TaxID=301880 RepID=A0ABQ4ZQC3_9ASTR